MGIFLKKGRPIKPKQLCLFVIYFCMIYFTHFIWNDTCVLWTGTHGITTVSEEVSVEVGATVSIPCLYKPSHKNLVKYLCKGGVWLSCDKIIKTNSKSSSPEGLYTISDDPDQGVFTVTIKSQKEGTQTYWCAVEMGFWTADAKTYFQLLVSKGECVWFTHWRLGLDWNWLFGRRLFECSLVEVISLSGKSSLYVDQQEITGFAGDSINISFDSKTHGKRGWCILGHCKEPQDGFIEGSHYSIDASKQGVFVVTMKDLDMESSGWYIFFQGKLNMPIHLIVVVNSKTTNTCKFKSVASKRIRKYILPSWNISTCIHYICYQQQEVD